MSFAVAAASRRRSEQLRQDAAGTILIRRASTQPMKTPLLAVSLFVTVGCLRGAEPPTPDLPVFNLKTLGLPSLSLNDILHGSVSTKSQSFSSLLDPRPTLRSLAPSTPRVNRDQRMPVLQPDPKVDFKMVVKVPDESVDYKMIVRTPGAEPSK